MSSEATNRTAVALQLADAWTAYASSCDNLEEDPAEVLAFAEGADDHEWSVVEALAGRTRPASPETRTATLTALAIRARESAGDPFASFTKDQSR